MDTVDNIKNKKIENAPLQPFTDSNKGVVKKVASAFKNIFRRKKEDTSITYSLLGRTSTVELSGQSLEVLVASLVRELDQKTPKFLKHLTDSCPSCMDLPEDCKFVDYSLFDVRKAAKRMEAYPHYIQVRVIEDLEKINQELGYHLRQRFMDDDE